MEGAEGMVAVVRGLGDAALAVTLLDGTREYTLMPNAVLHTSPLANKDVNAYRESKQRSTQYNSVATGAGKDSSRDMGAQVADGRYASTYKTTHCHVQPSSPPIELTEFPPQRVELCPGHGNFEVGGAGSGERFTPTKANGKYRGGMSWPDRGSVCSPRPSHETDAFANSLRRYPCMSPDRSSEIVERLINYSQSRASKTYSVKNHTTPRSPDSVSSSNPKTTRNCMNRTPQRRELSPKDRTNVDESPTRDRSTKDEGDVLEHRKTYCTNYSVKCCRETPKHTRDNIRTLPSCPYNRTVYPPIRESYYNISPSLRRYSDQYNFNCVDTEIQAAVRMVSKEVATVPRTEPCRRTVAVPLTPTTSVVSRMTESEFIVAKNTKSTQKSFHLKRKYVQTVSYTDLTSSDNDFEVRCSRKTKSQEVLKITDEYFTRKVSAVFENISCDDGTKDVFKEECLKRLLSANEGHRTRIMYNNRCIESIPIKYYKNCRYFGESVIMDDIGHEVQPCKKVSHLLCNEISSSKVHEHIDSAIRDWLEDLPINSESFDKEMKKENILNTMALKLKELISNIFTKEVYNLKSEIVNMIGNIPMVMNINCDKTKYLDKLVDALLEKIRNIFIFQNNECINNHNDDIPSYLKLGKNTQQTKENLKEFIRGHLWVYLKKMNLHFSETVMHDIENEITDILLNSLYFGNHHDVKHQIIYILKVLGNLTNIQSECVFNILLEKFREINKNCTYYQIFTVLYNSCQNNTVNETSDYSIGAITEEDIKSNFDLYMNQLCEQIEDWLNDLNISHTKDPGFRQVVIHDLAGDIIERRKYLELNLSSVGSDEEELEQLKYQIFKWINKLVGENNTETIQQADKLMHKIRNVPVPLLILPNKSPNKNNKPSNMCPNSYCQNSITNTSNPDQLKNYSNISIKDDENNTSQGVRNFQGHNSVNNCGMDFKVPMTTSSKRLSQQILKSSAQETNKNTYTEKLNSPVVARPQINRNIDCKVSCSGAISDGLIVRTPNNLGNIAPTVPDESMTEKRESFSNDRFSGPATTTPCLFGDSVNEQILPGQGALQSMVPSFNRSPDGISHPTSSRNNTLNTQLPPCCQLKDPTSFSSPSIRQLNEEFDDFLKKWVQEVPIVVSKPEEQVLVEKTRSELYNGIWKAITKLKFQPSIFQNRFYYQDMLDDETENLFNLIPKSPELEKKKHALKARLVEKTANTNEQILSLATSTFRQKLVESVENTLLNLDKTDLDVIKLHEELQKLSLAEEYILYIRYKNDDEVKSNAYKKKLLRHIEEFIDNLKKNHNKNLKDINPALYMNDIVSALNRVPVPSENTVRQEAGEILLGMEVEQWFADLPLVENYNYKVQLQRRHLRDMLTQKIYDTENEKSLSDCEVTNEIRKNIAKFLAKVPLEEGTDMNFLIDQLVNRLKNRPKESIRKKSVAFQEPQDYQEVNRNMDCCSSFTRSAGSNQIQSKSTGSLICRSVGFQEPQDYQEFSKNMPCCSSFTGPSNVLIDTGVEDCPNFQSLSSDEQYVSLLETKAPSCLLRALNQNTISGQSSQYYEQVIPPSSEIATTSQFYPNAQVGQSLYHLPQSNRNESYSTCCNHPSLPNTSKHLNLEPTSQTNERRQNSNLYEMAGNGKGILNTSQVAGPSGLVQSSKTASTQPCASPNFYKSTDQKGIQETIHNRSMSQQSGSLVGRTPDDGLNISEPFGYTTPQQMYQGSPPQRPKKNYHQIPRFTEGVRRKLELDDTESEVEREKNRCVCMGRCRKYKRKIPILVSCEDFDMECPRFVSIRCPYAYLY